MSMNDRTAEKSRSWHRKAILIGVGSLIDLPGAATYEAMVDLMPNPALTPLPKIYQQADRDLAETPSIG